MSGSMLTKLKSKFQSEEKKRLLSNFFSLAILQGANYILPLITLPYLVRVLGIEYFGLLAFATAIIAYFNIITDYGFNLTATREISIHRDDKVKVIEIFSSVMIIKFILMFVSFTLLVLLVFSFEKFSKDWEVYLLTFGTVLGQVLFPVWFFHGMEKMKYSTYLDILSKSIFTVAIFIFIQEQSDFYIVPILTSFGYIVAGIFSLVLIKKEFGVWFKWVEKETILYHLKEGWHIFLAGFGVNLYKNNAILILGIFTDNLIVGYFSIAKKIIDALNQVASVISRTILPYVNYKFELGTELFTFLKKIFLLILSYTFVLGVLLIMFSSEISTLIAGNIHTEIVISLKAMSFVPLIIAINIPAVHILLLSKNDKLFSKAVLLGGILDITLLVALIPLFSYFGAIISVIITEAFVTGMLYFYVYKTIKNSKDKYGR